MTTSPIGPDAGRRLLGTIPTGCFIGGQWRAAATGAEFAVIDPATEQKLLDVADGGPSDAIAALDAASACQKAWAATSPQTRADILLRAHALMLGRLEDFALLITLEMGKPVAESRGEVRYAADFLRWFGEQAVRVAGEYRVSPDARTRLITTRQPVGPCLLVVPWNFPLAMITRKVGPALAAGCTTIVKPAEDAPLSCLLMAQVLTEAGLPAGVVNVVPTRSPAAVVNPLLNDSRLRKISFTGSTAVGRQLLAGASTNVLRTSMELGGNAPLIVFDDADLPAAVEGAMLAKFRNGGESCVAVNRILVQEGVAEEFVRLLAPRIKALRLGSGTEATSELGPLINAKQRDRVVELVEDATERGAEVVVGGEAADGRGFFFPATLLTNVSTDARLCHEEVFGPVAAVYTFKTEADALAMANATIFGLVAYIFTASLARSLRFAESLEVGMVGVNRGLVSNAAAAFGGVKQSGLGREGGFEGIEEYLSVKYLAVDAE